MIKNFMLFEKINQGEPGVDDYVICENYENYIDSWNKVISKTIGRIVRIDIADSYTVLYVPPIFDAKGEIHTTYNFLIEDIKYWSKDKQDLQEILDAEKFGL